MEEFVFEKMFCECKEIPGFPGYYVNSYGRVWSDKSRKWLKLRNNGKGYLFVSLCHNGKSINKKIHRLVAEAFIPNDDPQTKIEVDHIDSNKANNRVDNLQWLNHENNTRKSLCKPIMLFDTLSGDIEQFDSQKDAAAFLGCSQPMMSKMAIKPQIKYMGWCVLTTKNESGDSQI